MRTGLTYPALLLGRGGSRGLPGKNVHSLLGRPLMTYPLLAASAATLVDEVYLSTDDAAIAAIGRRHGAKLIERPAALATDTALVENVVVHGFHQLVARRGEVDLFVLLLCNAATITPGVIDQGIRTLIDDPTLDSAVTVSRYNEYSPVRAKRIDSAGMLVPFCDVSGIPNVTCDRDTQGDVYYCDGAAWVLRARCMDLAAGVLPFRWMGRRTVPLIQSGGLDVDYADGLVRTEWWLSQHGFSELETPYDRPAEASAIDEGEREKRWTEAAALRGGAQ
ncbi:MAG: hypothetical protein WBC33_05635 [Conexibacter sp.]